MLLTDLFSRLGNDFLGLGSQNNYSSTYSWVCTSIHFLKEKSSYKLGFLHHFGECYIHEQTHRFVVQIIFFNFQIKKDILSILLKEG